MAVSRNPIIAKDGWLVIALAASLVAVIVYFTNHYFAVLWLFPILLLWFYRDPFRELPSTPLGMLSPVDGTVVRSEPHPDPFLGRDAHLLQICMSMTNVFSIRSITEGKIIQQWLDPEDDDDDASLAHAIQIKTDEGDDVMIVVRPGRFFKKLSCDVVIGERIGQGYRCGFIPFGSCVDVYVPQDSIISAKIGDKVVGGTSILASLQHHS